MTVATEGAVRYRTAVDHTDRQALLRTNLSDDPGFDGEDWLAVKGVSRGWLHYAAPGYDDHAAATPPADLGALRNRGWTRAAAGEGQVVLVPRDAGLDRPSTRPTDDARLLGSRVRAVVDSREDHLVTVRRTRRFETDVRRPDVLGPRRPAELPWDAAAY